MLDVVAENNVFEACSWLRDAEIGIKDTCDFCKISNDLLYD